MKSCLRTMVCLAAGMFMAFAATDADAQRPAHYYPARPTFSPYLLYRQLNLTGIPNYYSYVEPATKFRDALVRGQTLRPAQRQSVLGPGEVARIIQRELRQRDSTGIGAPSVPARYGEYSHFYGASATQRRR